MTCLTICDHQWPSSFQAFQTEHQSEMTEWLMFHLLRLYLCLSSKNPKVSYVFSHSCSALLLTFLLTALFRTFSLTRALLTFLPTADGLVKNVT